MAAWAECDVRGDRPLAGLEDKHGKDTEYPVQSGRQTGIMIVIMYKKAHTTYPYFVQLFYTKYVPVAQPMSCVQEDFEVINPHNEGSPR